MQVEELKRNLGIAAACTGGIGALLYPAGFIALGLGVALGYRCRDSIHALLEEVATR